MTDTTRSQETVERIAAILDGRRKQLDLTLQQLASRLGVSVATVHNLMTGNHSYPMAILTAVVKALDWSWLEFALIVGLPDLSNTREVDRQSMRRTAERLAKALRERHPGTNQST